MNKTRFLPLLLASVLIIFVAGVAFAWLPAAAQTGEPPERLVNPDRVIFIAQEDPSDTLVHIPAPLSLLTAAPAASNITVNYIYAWPPQAQAAFEYAVQVWEQQLTSPVPIVVNAYWEDLSYWGPNVLGGAGPTDYWFDDTTAVFPIAYTLYPSALASKYAGQDLNGADPEIEASFNSSFSGWYFGLDSQPPNNTYDFVSVVLHELGHGLGFAGTMMQEDVTSPVGWGLTYPNVYDRLVENAAGQNLVTSFPNWSPELNAQLRSNSLFFRGAAAITANGGVRPKIYAPATWYQGSSFSHLDESTYPPASGKSLMTPIISDGEAVHDPGALTRAMMQDIGWTTQSPQPEVTPTPVVIYGEPVAFLPSVSRDMPCADPCLFGRVTDKSSPAGGVKIDLLRFNGNNWVQQATTNTNSRGYYIFKNAPALPSGQVYVAQYLNPSPQQAGRLLSWTTALNYGYSGAGDSRRLGDFDIADVVLTSPASGASVTFPVAFKWTPRPGWNSDRYQVALYSNPAAAPLWRSPELGYVGSFTLAARPANIQPGVAYSWALWIYNEDGSSGRSRSAFQITFP